MNTKDLCLSLAAANGISGDEDEICLLTKELLSEYMPTHIDSMKNVTGRLQGSGKHILLDAHLDRIGLIVRGISPQGFVLFERCGGVDPRTLIGSEVTVFGEKPLFGVVCSVPPHLSNGDDKLPKVTDMAIDIGYSEEEAKKLVFPGDRIMLNARQHSLLGDYIASPALDNRAGVATVLKCLEILKDNNANPNLTVLFSSREEVNKGGARTGAFDCGAEEAIVIDVTFAASHGVSKDEGGVSGDGAMIGFSPVLNHALSKKLVSVAKENDIPFQIEVMGRSTGTNADEISVSCGGIKTVTLSVPVKGMHTGVEVVSVKDIDLTARLLAQYIMTCGGDENA